MKARKKPVVVEAILWNGQNIEEVLEFTEKENRVEEIQPDIFEKTYDIVEGE